MQYPIVVSDDKTYSDCTFDLSGKTVSHLFELVAASRYATLTFRNVTFKNVLATENGGCVYVESEKFPIVNFIDCTFINCSTTGHSGVIYMENSTNSSGVLVENCTVKNCSANGYGGFMYENYERSMDSIKNTTFVDCHAKYGGAIYYNRGNRNLEINGCTASEDGGFVYVNNGDANLLINDSEFSGCTVKNGAQTNALGEPYKSRADNFNSFHLILH